MDPRRFDRFAKHLASRSLSRRRVSAAVAGLAAASLGSLGQVAAQNATPAPNGAGALLADDNATLFVQTAGGGTFKPHPQAGQPLATPVSATPAMSGTPVAAKHGDYLLTLTGHTGETIAFSDRPQRQFGEVKTSQFFGSMGFTPANPPNAALVADSDQQEDDVLLIELFNPAYDAHTQTLTYEVNILQHYAGELLQPMAAKQQDQQMAEEFGSASLFIDDCPDLTGCYRPQGLALPPLFVGALPGGPIGTCWHWSSLSCDPCNGNSDSSYDTVCNNSYPSQCQGACSAG